jgi:hypothetical protein
LCNMRQFYAVYPEDQIFYTLCRNLSSLSFDREGIWPVRFPPLGATVPPILKKIVISIEHGRD